VQRLETRVDELAKPYVDQVASMGGRCDFAQDIAVHYPLQMILSILGLPEAGHGRMLHLTQALYSVLGLLPRVQQRLLALFPLPSPALAHAIA
jgi:cytochrome P450